MTMQMQMPTVTEQHKKLEMLAGTWKGEEKIYPSPWDPKGGGAMGKITARIDLDGFHLITDYIEERDGKVSYRGHGVYGWDGNEKRYTMYWFDSVSGGGSCSTMPAKGEWSGNTLTFLQQSPMGHARYTYAFEGEGRYVFKIEMSQDGQQWTPFMEGRYTRV